MNSKMGPYHVVAFNPKTSSEKDYITLQILISKTTLLVQKGQNRMVTVKYVYFSRLIKKRWTSPCFHTQTLFASKTLKYTTEVHEMPDDVDKMGISIDCFWCFSQRWVVLADTTIRNWNTFRLGWISFSVGHFPILLRTESAIWTQNALKKSFSVGSPTCHHDGQFSSFNRNMYFIRVCSDKRTYIRKICFENGVHLYH